MTLPLRPDSTPHCSNHLLSQQVFGFFIGNYTAHLYPFTASTSTRFFTSTISSFVTSSCSGSSAQSLHASHQTLHSSPLQLLQAGLLQPKHRISGHVHQHLHPLGHLHHLSLQHPRPHHLLLHVCFADVLAFRARWTDGMNTTRHLPLNDNKDEELEVKNLGLATFTANQDEPADDPPPLDCSTDACEILVHS